LASVSVVSGSTPQRRRANSSSRKADAKPADCAHGRLDAETARPGVRQPLRRRRRRHRDAPPTPRPGADRRPAGR
jgi:hypothetical protein